MRKEKKRLILRLRLRAMTIDGMVDEGGPYFLAQRGNAHLGSGHLGACTRIGRYPVGGDFHVVECGTAQLRLSACSRDEIQAIGTTFGIPGDIDFSGVDDPRKAVHFPYVARCLYESPFWDAMVAFAVDELAQARKWGSDGDERTHMGWRGAVTTEAKGILSRRATVRGGKGWGHVIVPADLMSVTP